jgi:5-methylcytosine-specific restriction enzyme subunit McrC
MQLLYENQKAPKELEEYIKANSSLHPYFESLFSGVKSKNYCGFLQAKEESYFIAPKISDTNEQNLNIFIYMVIFAYDIKINNIDIINSTTTPHKIFELFIKLFSDNLLNELKKGVFKEYITCQENLKVLKGRYIVEKNFNNFYNQNIYCEFDEFSEDNELNRFFLYAIKEFKKFSAYPNLHRCEAILSEVSHQSFDINRLNIHFNRLNARFKQSFELALMILKKLTPLTQKDTQKSFAFLFDMSEIFEKFVARLCKEIYSDTKIQTEKRFGSLHLKPDIILNNKIIDTKYKKLNSRDNLVTNDKYQMFTYGINFGIKETMLLYPKYLIDINDNLELGKGDNLVKLQLKSLDLSFDGEFKEYIKIMKERVREII